MTDLDPRLVTAPETTATAVIGLGSNLGDSRQILAEAVEQFRHRDDVEVIAVSPVAKTAPVGGPKQPDYLNQVLIVSTRLAPYALLRTGQALEEAAARIRDERWGPRTLDVDLIVYQDVTSDHPVLTLPHPRAHQRAFVLAPWSWADPQATLHGTPVADLAAHADDADTVEPIEEGS